MAVRALGIILLFSLIAVLSGQLATLPVPEKRTHEERTPLTELQPPPLDEKEHYVTVYVINLLAVKNGSSDSTERILENEVIQTVPDIVEPFATALLIVKDNEDEEKDKHSPVDLDEFAKGLESRGFKVDKINLNGKSKVLKMKLEKAEVQNIIESTLEPSGERKDRQKRAGGRGGYGGGYGHGGYGHGGYGHGHGGYGHGHGGYGHGHGGGWGEYHDGGGRHYPGGDDGGHGGGHGGGCYGGRCGY